MTMESRSKENSPSASPEVAVESPVSPQLPVSAAVEPAKKRPAFSISSILGEDDKPAKHARASVSPSNAEIRNNEEVYGRDIRKTPTQFELSSDAHRGVSGSPFKSSSPPSGTILPPQPIGSPRLFPGFPTGLGTAQDAQAKYNALIAAAQLSSNPDLAKLYRWPMLFNPWMAGLQAGAAPGFPAGLPRPPFLQHGPISAISTEGFDTRGRNGDDSKESVGLEAGEIVRPVACRRPAGQPLDPQAPAKSPGHPGGPPHPGPPPPPPHHFQALAAEHAALLQQNADKHRSLLAKSQHSNASSAPPPTMTSLALSHSNMAAAFSQRGGGLGTFQGNLDILKFNSAADNDKNLGGHFDDSDDKDNEMVEIEIDEDVSDNENDENNQSRDDEDGLNKSNCERKKKTRTVFSRSQIFQLETMFDMKRYLSSSERAGLAKALNMTETQVKIWFQNRRNKWKRQIAAEMEAANMSQVTGQRLMQLPYMYSHEELSRGMRTPGISMTSLPPNSHPVVPPSVHHYYGNMLRAHTS